jgi:ribose transport system substrate-binding protein
VTDSDRCQSSRPRGEHDLDRPALPEQAERGAVVREWDLVSDDPGQVFGAPFQDRDASSLWYISCGQAYTACAEQSDGFSAAGKALGWNVNLTDGKAQPTTASSLIRQAIAAKADGIAITAFDCPGIKTALRQAKAANIPVVTALSLDCDQPAFGGGEPLFTASAKIFGSTNQGAYYAAWSRARADWIIANSNGTANVLAVEDQDQLLHKLSNQGFAAEMAKCAGCKVTVIPFTFSQVPNPATQVWTSGIESHPQAGYLSEDIDSLMSLGLRSAILQSRRHDLKVAGAEGFPYNLQMIQQGLQTVALAVPQQWVGWAEADTLNRVFAGQKVADLPNEGLGWQINDKAHNNLPPSGQAYQAPVSYAADYEKVWNGGS